MAFELHLTDGVTGQEYPLTYNGAGSLTSDAGRRIARIDYDCRNNPVRIQFTNGNVTRYVYSATGEKLRVIYQTAVPNITVAIGSARELMPSEILYTDSTDYLLGGALTLKNGRIDMYQFDEGYCQATQYNATQDNFTFLYYDKDHLGNVRQVTKASNSNGTVVQTMNYYPFGAQFCDGSATTSDVQPYKYNGKEFDKMHGLNTYDYGARQYNPVTARWDRVDPLSEKYYSVSPYAYCAGNPINYIDPDGRDWYMTSDSTVQWLSEVTSQENTPDGGTYIGKEYNGLAISTYETNTEESEYGVRRGLIIILSARNTSESDRWIQNTKTQYMYPDNYNTDQIVDKDQGQTTPFYYNETEEKDKHKNGVYTFSDMPGRDEAHNCIWQAELSLVSKDRNRYFPKVTLVYGFHNLNRHTTTEPIKIVTPSPFQQMVINLLNSKGE